MFRLGMYTNFPVIGIASYNGYTFSPLAETVSCRVKPIYDQAGRTVIYSILSVGIKDRIIVGTPPSNWPAGTPFTIDTAFQTIRQQLTVPGGEYHYKNTGLGNI